MVIKNVTLVRFVRKSFTLEVKCVIMLIAMDRRSLITAKFVNRYNCYCLHVYKMVGKYYPPHLNGAILKKIVQKFELLIFIEFFTLVSKFFVFDILTFSVLIFLRFLTGCYATSNVQMSVRSHYLNLLFYFIYLYLKNKQCNNTIVRNITT